MVSMLARDTVDFRFDVSQPYQVGYQERICRAGLAQLAGRRLSI